MTMRPDACPKCSVEWDPTTAGIQSGYRELGAYVWECVACGNVLENQDPSDRVVARR